MLSLRELRRAVQIIHEKIPGATLRRIAQPDAFQLVLTFEGSTGKQHLLLACSPETARVCLTGRAENTASPGSFYEYIHAHLVGGVVASIVCSTDNRQISMRLQSRSRSDTLILSILGARSNIYLLDTEGKLAHAMRSLDETRHELKIGEAWTDPRGAVPSDGEDRWAEVPDGLYLDAMDESYRQLELRNKAELLAKRIQQAVKKERAFLDRKSINLREDLGEALQAESCKKKGELLKNVLHTIRHGDDKVAAADYQTGEILEIPLDPKLSPVANLEAYFARYQKQSRGALVIQRQIDDLEFAQSGLDAIEQSLERCFRSEPPDLHGLESIEALPDVRRLLHRYAPKRKAVAPLARASQKKEIPTRLLPKRYKTQDGLEIWVGRSDEGNDYLTTRLARGNDLFFHLEGYPGSHVVLRTEGRLDSPPGSLLDACELAAHYSKLKNAGTVDIHVAPIKDVKKPKGAKPGLVYARKGKTIHLKRNPKRLQNILAARLD
jgi:predicted ribosome quality control (RQC) complex YloA/Tae2 family protein